MTRRVFPRVTSSQLRYFRNRKKGRRYRKNASHAFPAAIPALSAEDSLTANRGNMTRQDGTRHHVSQGMKRCPGMASTLICSYSPVIKNFFTFFFSRGHLRRWNHELRHWGRRRRALGRRCSSQDRGRRDGCATIAITREFLSRDCSHKAPGKKLKCHAR